jgi:hypothetical protein
MTAPITCIPRRCGNDVTSAPAGCHNSVTGAAGRNLDVPSATVRLEAHREPTGHLF